MNTQTTPTQNGYWTPLPYRLIKVSGIDRQSFLQGQLTQDVRLFTETQAQYAAYCNNKARLHAVFLGFAEGDSYFLRVHRDIADETLTKLKRFILRSKVQLTLTEHHIYALNYVAVQAYLTEQTIKQQASLIKSLPDLQGLQTYQALNIIQLPTATLIKTLAKDYWLLCINTASGENNGKSNAGEAKPSETGNTLSDLTALAPMGELADYQAALLKCGDFDILPNTVETILPQTTSLVALGAISYDKGCYVGQEIIARNKYLGEVKRGMAWAQAALPAKNSAPEEVLAVGDPVVDGSGQVVGQLLSVIKEAQHTTLLAVISKIAIESALKVKQTDIHFQPLGL